MFLTSSDLVILRLSAVLFLAFLGASLGAAVAPWLPLVLVGGTYLIGRQVVSEDPARTLLGVGLGFIGLLTIPIGFLTHGVLTGGAGPFRAQSFDDPEALSTRMPLDSVDALGGTLISYAATTDDPPVVAFRSVDGRIRWASALPPESGVTGLQQMQVFPVLWRIRVDVYAAGPDTPGWFYVWRWGGVQKIYLLTEEP